MPELKDQLGDALYDRLQRQANRRGMYSLALLHEIVEQYCSRNEPREPDPRRPHPRTHLAFQQHITS